MVTLTLEFYECEHSGDVQRYERDIVACGGRVTNYRLFRNETCEIEFQVSDEAQFWAEFKHTSAYGFLN